MSVKLKINSFTVFNDFDIEFCDGINILIGKNGVGKTHLLKLLLTLIPLTKDQAKKQNRETETVYIPSQTGQIQFESIFDIDQITAYMNLVGGKYEIVFDDDIQSVVFIPDKDMLSHAGGLLSMKKKYGSHMPFDFTLLDVIEKAQAWKLNTTPAIALDVVPALEKIMEGSVEVRDDGSFWMKKTNGKEIPFSMEAEGVKRLGLLWQLLMNESINANTLLLWDEPEVSINPENIPALVNALLQIQRHGVKMVLATHNYNFARYFDISRTKTDIVKYFSLFSMEDGYTGYSTSDSFMSLQPNSIDAAGDKLFNDVINKSMEEI